MVFRDGARVFLASRLHAKVWQAAATTKMIGSVAILAQALCAPLQGSKRLQLLVIYDGAPPVHCGGVHGAAREG